MTLSEIQKISLSRAWRDGKRNLACQKRKSCQLWSIILCRGVFGLGWKGIRCWSPGDTRPTRPLGRRHEANSPCEGIVCWASTRVVGIGR